MMKSGSFESLKSYLLAFDFKKSIVPLLTSVKMSWNVLIYYINRVSLSHNYILVKCYNAVFQKNVDRYDLGLSNEPLFIIIGQGAAKLWPFKFGSPKKIRPWTKSTSISISKGEGSKAIFSDLQLWQVTVLQPLDLWQWIGAHLKALSHICLHLT